MNLDTIIMKYLNEASLTSPCTNTEELMDCLRKHGIYKNITKSNNNSVHAFENPGRKNGIGLSAKESLFKFHDNGKTGRVEIIPDTSKSGKDLIVKEFKKTEPFGKMMNSIARLHQRGK